MLKRLRSLAVTVWITGGLALMLAVAPAAAQEVEEDGAEQAVELAERYAPIVVVKAQTEECDPYGEAYAPASVETVLDNPEVLLRQVSNGDPVVMRGPGAADLFELGAGFYLDFPGSSLEPGCIYEQDFDRYSRDTPTTVYAHVVQQEGHPEQLALQYWFYWYYNDWNNKHESDWEGIQLLFDASSVAEALRTEPTSIGFAQHEGGERADWGSAKLERSGSHPVVYSSAGSHASYFDSAVYLGRSGSEGFGCDTTAGPSERLTPEVILLPDGADDPTDQFAWLSFEGRWGERQRGAFNGPTGPTDKDRWLEPIEWHDDLRASSVVIPGGDSTAVGVVRTFCSAVEAGSGLLLSFTVSPLRVLLAAGLLVLLVRFLIGRTDWRLVPLFPLRRSRAAGQILRAAAILTRRYWMALAVFGAVYIPIALIVGLLSGLVSSLPLIRELLDLTGVASGTSLVLAVFAGGVPHLFALVAVNGLVAVFLDRGGVTDRQVVREAVRQVAGRWRSLVGGLALALVVVAGLLLTIVGIPLAIRQLVRYQFLPQVVVLEGREGRQALARSSDLVTGRWWRTAAVIGTINIGLSATALLTGLVVLVAFSGIPFWLFTAVVSLIYVIVVPPAAVAQSLLYGDAVAEEARPEAPAADDAGVLNEARP